ncbi:MAG: succinate dehydrogenase, cytochrome b556 subunit [Pseudomonadota bacterium]|jgi:succinate dehydrogenase / fumarate reductase cytochrome b subunit
MSELAKKSRPQFRNIHITQLMQYRLPAAGIMSILHRVSGAGMFLTLPLILWIFDLSLTSELSYARLVELTSSPLMKIVLCGLVWAFLHHLFAGIRHLVSDLHIGLAKEQSAAWGKGVMGIALLLSFVAWLKIFGAF